MILTTMRWRRIGGVDYVSALEVRGGFLKVINQVWDANPAPGADWGKMRNQVVWLCNVCRVTCAVCALTSWGGLGSGRKSARFNIELETIE